MGALRGRRWQGTERERARQPSLSGGPAHLWYNPPNTLERLELSIPQAPSAGPKRFAVGPHGCRSSPADLSLLLALPLPTPNG